MTITPSLGNDRRYRNWVHLSAIDEMLHHTCLFLHSSGDPAGIVEVIMVNKHCKIERIYDIELLKNTNLERIKINLSQVGVC